MHPLTCDIGERQQNMAKAKTDETFVDQVAFDYIKSAHFRVIHADGAIGTVTPSGYIHLAFFSERQAIPRRIVHKVAKDGELGPQVDDATESRGSIVREMDIDVIFSVEVAEALKAWLEQRIKEAQSRQPKKNRKDGQ